MTQGFAGPPLGGGGPFAPIIVDTDPGAVGAGRLWLTSAGVLSMRNAANDGWLTLSAAATPDLATVLAAGNDPGGSPIVGASAAGANGASLAVNAAPGTGVGGDANLGGGQGAAGKAGGAATLTAGAGDNGKDDPAYLTVHPGDGIGGAGKVTLKSAGSLGTAGQALLADGAGTAAWGLPPGASPLVSVGPVITRGGTSFAYNMAGHLDAGNILVAAIASNQYTVVSIVQAGVTWSLVDAAALTAGDYAIAELWVGVVGAGAKARATITMTGNNTNWAVMAEFAGYAGTIASHGAGTQATGADLVLGPITSSAGNLIVGAICNVGAGDSFFGLANATPGVVNPGQIGLGWRVSGGVALSPGTTDAGNNMAGAWGVIV